MKTSTLLAGAAILPMLMANIAFAQSTSGFEDEIVVTAQKRTQNIKDVPISVATVSSEKLEAILDGGADIRALAGRIPSVYVEGSSGRSAPRFYIRGLGNVDFDLQASQPVSIVMDEVVMENVLLKSFPLFDVGATEVLRGPQGTLFGRNTPAGIIKFDSVKPSQDTEGYVSASYGSFGASKVEGAIGGGLSDSISARVSFQLNNRNDNVENVNPNAAFSGNNDGEDDYGGYRDIAARAQLAFEPSDNFNSLLSFVYRDLDGTTTLFRANILDRGSNSLNSNFVRDQVTYDGGQNNFSLVETFGFTFKNQLDFGDITLTSVSGYFDGSSSGIGDIDGGVGASFLPGGSSPGLIIFPSETGTRDNEFSQFTQEVRLSNSNPGDLNWQIGAYYFEDEVLNNSLNFSSNGSTAPNRIALTIQESQTLAVFGQLSYDLTDKFNVTAGLRYSDDEKSLVGSRPLGNPVNIDTSVADDRVTYDIAGSYTLSDNTTLFARYANGFRSPSIQGRALFSDTVTTANSEVVDSFDLGFKSTLFDNSLRLNGAVFYYKVDDQQFTAIGGAGNFSQLINADKGVGKGFELDADWLATDNLRFTAGISYNDTEIQDEDLLVAVCAQCTVTDPRVTVGTSSRASIDGNPFPQAPDWILAGTARYSVPVEGGEFYAFTDWNWQGDTNFFLYESVEFNSSGNFEGGLRVGYENFDGGYELAAFVRNITGEDNLVGGIDFNNLTGFVNEPRTWGVEAKYNF